eukprot:jgi/Chlat1/8468/Chrsp80S07863
MAERGDMPDGPMTPRGLQQKAQQAFRDGDFQKAIDVCTLALRLSPAGQQEELLSCRSTAFASLSKRLRRIPAAQSENRALYGLDPLSLAQLALKDAEVVVRDNPKSPDGFALKGAAHFLLEQYNEAEEAYLAGLQLDPSRQFSAQLQEGVKALDAEGVRNVGSATKRPRIARSDEFDCTVCLKLMYEPVTTPCGHSFCRACLARSMDGNNRCPMCRTVLFVTARSHPVSVSLQNILEKTFPQEYEERRAEMSAVEACEAQTIAVFVMDVVLPGQKMALNIFEPRYRLMIRRCMEGNRRFAMAGYEPRAHEPADVACEVEIVECAPLPDGRILLEVVGRRRFRAQRYWEQDGYRMAEAVWFKDDDMDPAEAEEVEELAKQAEQLAQRWIERLRAAASGRQTVRLVELLGRAGEMPPRTQYDAFSFWVANLLPIETNDRMSLLRMTSTKQRLAWEAELLSHGDLQTGTCSIQ